VFTNKTGEPSIGVTPACGRVEVGGVATLSAPAVWKVGWVSNETAEAPSP